MSGSGRPPLYGDLARWGLVHADALALLGQMPDCSVHSVLVDPPYGLDLGGHTWDGADIRRAVKASERMSDGEAFERWTRAWAEQVVRVLRPGGHVAAFGATRTWHRLACGLQDAGLELIDTLMYLHGAGVPKSRRLPGDRGTGLKPVWEPIVLGRRALTGTVAANVARWGTGALNIGACRTGEAGYWPANIVFSHDPCCTEERCARGCPLAMLQAETAAPWLSRIFYCAKASRAERDAGCEQLPARSLQLYSGRPRRLVRNHHPTPKPLGLLRHLVKLITPEGGVVLDPFCGSASTGAAAVLEGRQFLGIEREGEYIEIGRARLTHWAAVSGAGDGTAKQGSGSPLSHTSTKGGPKKGGSNAKRTST